MSHWRAISWFLGGFGLLLLILLLERLVGLPTLFLWGWLQSATQLRLRWSLALSLGASLLVAAVYGVDWHWSFLVVWLGSWLVNWRHPSPANRWWRSWGWAAAGSSVIGALAQLTGGAALHWLVWLWPLSWLVVAGVFRWRRYV